MTRASKETHNHCHISMRVTDLQTGEQRQLSEDEIAKRLEQVLALSPLERVRMGKDASQPESKE